MILKRNLNKKNRFMFLNHGLFFYVLLMSHQLFAASSFEIKHWKSAEGVPIVFHQSMSLPILDVYIVFAAGSAYDKNRFGLSRLTTKLLHKSSQTKDAQAIAQTFADLGANYQSTTNRDMSLLSLRMLSDQESFDKAIKNLNLILTQANFSDQAIIQEKQEQIMQIIQKKSEPNLLADDFFYQMTYQKHPYGHPIEGTETTVKSISRKEILNFYHQYFVARNARIIIFGAIDENKAHELANSLTQKLPLGQAAKPISPKSPTEHEINIEIPFHAKQSSIRLGQVGIQHNDPNYFPLLVGNHILGNPSLVSILFDEIREKRGLTYGISSQLKTLEGKGPFLISVATQTKQSQKTSALIREILAKYIKEGPSETELNAAKEFLTGNFPLTLASSRSMASILINMSFYHMPEDFLETYCEKVSAVSAVAIREAFQKLIDVNTLIEVKVGG